MTSIRQALRRHLHLLLVVAIGPSLADVHFLGAWALLRNNASDSKPSVYIPNRTWHAHLSLE